MNYRRALLGVAGVTLVSLAIAASGLVSALVPSGPLVSLLGNDYAFVALLGLAGLVVAAVVVGRGDAVDQTRMPDPESATAVLAPGDEFAATLGRWQLVVPFAGRELEGTVRDRLREAAVRTVRRTGNCDADAARDRVADGTWTEDRHAAAFLADGARPSLGARLEAALHGDAWFVYGARRTAAAVADLAESGGRRTDRSEETPAPSPDRTADRGGRDGPSAGGPARAGAGPVADGGRSQRRGDGASRDPAPRGPRGSSTGGDTGDGSGVRR